LNRDQKAAVIDEIAADISAAQAIFAVDYRGITVAQAEALRARLREADASFRVVKNSLTERAADRAGADQLKPLLEGPTALTFARGDAAAAARAVAEFARATQLLAFKGGVMDGAALSSAEVGVISRLPSREVLYGQLVGLVANPLSGLARSLNALIGGLAIGLGGVLSKKESGEIPAGEAPVVEAAEAGAEPGSTVTGTDGAGSDDAAVASTEEASAEEASAEEASAEEASAEEASAEQAPAEEVSGDAVGDEALGEEPAGAPETPADADEPMPQEDGPDKDSGDALETTTEPEAEAPAAAEAEHDGAAPEAPSGDDEKEDQ
jgi:large subunit ribosomal protein L10